MAKPLELYSDRHCNLAFIGLQSIFWMTYCSYFSFLVPYLQSNGYSGITIGFVYTMQSAIAITLPLVYGYICDFWLPAKKLVLMGLVLAVPLAFLLRQAVLIVPLAFLSIACMGIVERSLPSVIDGWGMKLVGEGVEMNYGLARGLGSLAFAFTALFLGRLYDKAGHDSRFWVHAILACICILAVSFLPEIPVQGKSHEKKLSFSEAFSILLKNREFVVFAGCGIFVGMTGAMHSTFLPMYLTTLGGTSSSLGLYWFVLAASEFPMMMLSRRIISRFSIRPLMLFCMWFMILRAVVPFFVPSAGWLIAVQVMQAISYGLYFPVLLQYINIITDRRVFAMAVTIGVVCTDALPSIIGNLLGGFIADYYGVSTIFLVFTGMIFIGALAFTLLSRNGHLRASRGEESSET